MFVGQGRLVEEVSERSALHTSSWQPEIKHRVHKILLRNIAANVACEFQRRMTSPWSCVMVPSLHRAKHGHANPGSIDYLWWVWWNVYASGQACRSADI